ncbi:MAG: DNA-directed RNA polymerase subunit beta' [Chlamydiae bacterium]|nr:DNA-directed RNA polymerase subunit beta' [Chlamydiota bacterium]MBI3266655.1 DNA-directed RNA polymerase subunit beta' [Chlamydiota bacterium]
MSEMELERKSPSGYEEGPLFSKISIRLASPDIIREWSKGEVKNPETINYRTFKPEKGGLFCERIFGPTKDWECSCGKYKRIKHKGVVCDRCGVEVTQARVRRDRMGHIELATPVAHIWFFKAMPSRIGNILGLPTRILERVLYYEDYIVTDPGTTALEAKQLLTESEYRQAQETYGKGFTAKMGAEAIKDLLKREDLSKLAGELRADLKKTKSQQAKKKFSKRLKIVEGFRKSGNKADWMILDVVPVIPPDLRPLVPLEGGRFATSDLNDLYRRVINRNNRLKTILQLKTPDVIVRNEKRMLQEAVDAIFDNGRHGRPVLGSGNRPLKSLADMLKGKQGRFRQNLLGKRVDYSGRAVIVVGPELKLHQCGLPKKMALELFEPFIIRRLKELGHVHTIRSAKKLIEAGAPEVWDILEGVIKEHPVLLNRAPTLHRLGIQGFEPQLIEGEAIRIHPLVCTAFNADFDGDQMAVHVPLSVEAQLETKLLMLSTNNVFSPSSGKPVLTPTQDIILGCYYLTKNPSGPQGKTLRAYSDSEEALLAYSEGILKTHDRIKLRFNGKMIDTTVGRVIFNDCFPRELWFMNDEVNKKALSKIIIECYRKVGHQRTIEVLDRVKQLGFHEATRAGISISMDDMIVPDEKVEIIQGAQKEVERVEKQYRAGSITEGERYNKIVDIWTHATDSIAEALFKGLEENKGRGLNPLFIMVDSGSRGSKQQIRQLSGMRGLMAKPSGEIIESPIISNFKEGLSVLEYFISTHGARKGLADTALKTADSGYLTRRLVDVAQDVIITEVDCRTLNGIEARPIFEGDEEVVTLRERIVGRVSLDDLVHPVSKEAVVHADEEINEKAADQVEKLGFEKVRIRSVLTCESLQGVCAKCYGRNLATGKIVDIGCAAGIIAAQSIGEPGTQLTMRTFHIGGTASQVFKQPQIAAKNDGIIRYSEAKVVLNKEGNHVVLNKTGVISIFNEEGRELEKHTLVVGSLISVPHEGKVKKGEIFVRWDPYNVPILTEQSGFVRFHDIIEGSTMKRELDQSTGLIGTVIVEHKQDLHPQIIITDKEGKEIYGYYSIPAGAHVVVGEGDYIEGGSLLAKTPRKISKTKDITGGLPRVAELFEARRPKDASEIAKIDGVVEFRGTFKGKRLLIVKDELTGIEEEHLIPHKKHLTVYKGDRVKKGQQLTEGPIVPQEILQVCGPKELQEYLVNQIQEVYRLQGVEINDKHIEIIIRQMLRKVVITDPGDTDFLYNEQVDKIRFRQENEKVMKNGGKPAEASPSLLGITKASLSTESFISAASFQETTRVLTEAASEGKVDHLRGFKENVIMGHLIPGGTGCDTYQDIKVTKTKAEELPLLEKEEAGEILKK